MKKILNRITLSLGTLGVIVAGAAAFSAFEAHVINVTARIENALNVPIDFIEFGTVFPQEKLEKPLAVTLSGSFLADDQNRVDTVSYFIRQKPKCALTSPDGQTFYGHEYTATGHIKFGDNPATETVEQADNVYVDCGTRPVTPTENAELSQAVWGVLPNLCPYLSKHSEIVSREPLTYEDGALASFHKPWVLDAQNQTIDWTDVGGTVSKPNDTTDNWVIDLAVPCFGGYCAQDWENFVKGVNPEANPSEYTQPIENEHKIFGCDLWVEVNGVTSTPTAE